MNMKFVGKYNAIGDTVLIEVPEVEKITKRDSGLVLIENESSSNPTVIGTIISVGEGKYDEQRGTYIKPPLERGDKVILPLSTGMEIEKGLRMVKMDDIFAKVNGAS